MAAPITRSKVNKTGETIAAETEPMEQAVRARDIAAKVKLVVPIT